MFVRRVKKSGNSISVRIVENNRNSNGSVKQNLIRIVGTGKTEEEVNILERAALEMILSLQRGNNAGKESSIHNIPDDIKFNSVKESKRINDGFIDVFGPFYEKYGFNRIITGTYKDEQWNKILMALVLGRIINPTSKRKTMSILSKKYLTDIPLEKAYRTMDRVHLFEANARDIVLNQTKIFCHNKINIMLFDVTTLYFESFTSDELKENGFSKDSKFKEMQVVLSLTLTPCGLPIDYTLFPGNTWEGHTLIKSIKKIKNRFNCQDVTLIADRAMFTEDNLNEMESEGFKYIVACKLKSLRKSFKEKILSDQDYVASVVEEDLCWAKSYDYEEGKEKEEKEEAGRKIIVSYSTKRALKDRKHRDKLIDRILKKAKDGKVKVSDLIT